jgi:AcrR family transcriptional regulator
MDGDRRDRRREEARARLFEAAKARWRRGDRVELAGLAAETGVSRASAYRWFGDNDRLLAEVLVERARENFAAECRRHDDTTGRERVLAIASGFLHHVAESEPLTALLRREPQRAMTIIASGAHDVQRTVVAAFEGLLEEERDAGNLELAVDAHTMAYAMVRIFEAFLYADIVAGEERDVDRAVDLAELLLLPPRTPGSGSRAGARQSPVAANKR